MPTRNDMRSIPLIGSGPAVIRQACGSDDSRTQACAAVIEEVYRATRINGRPAAIRLCQLSIGPPRLG